MPDRRIHPDSQSTCGSLTSFPKLPTPRRSNPPLQPGHIYRLRVQPGQGVGAGDRFKLHINGSQVAQTKEGLGRRGGDTIRGAWITPDIAKDFGR